MLYLAIGVSGFVAVVLYDLAQLHGKRVVAAVFSSIGYLSIVTSIVFLILSVSLPQTPFGVLAPEIVVSVLAFLLLVYSVFIEIPLARRRSSTANGREVVSAGFYGVMRHPGFLWFVLFWASIMFIYRNALVVQFGFLLIALDLALVLLEDAVFFPRIFAGYDAYKRRVPFILPRPGRKSDDVQL